MTGPRRARSAAAASRPRGTAKDRALGLLAVRWRSRDELRRRLLAAGFEPADVATALEDLERAGLVDDARFARELVRDQAGRRLAGDRAIRAALRQKGVALVVAEDALQEAGGDDADRARELAESRVRRLTGLSPEVAYRRLFGLLVRRGYGPGVAREASRAVLASVLPDDAGLGPGD